MIKFLLCSADSIQSSSRVKSCVVYVGSFILEKWFFLLAVSPGVGGKTKNWRRQSVSIQQKQNKSEARIKLG